MLKWVLLLGAAAVALVASQSVKVPQQGGARPPAQPSAPTPYLEVSSAAIDGSLVTVTATVVGKGVDVHAVTANFDTTETLPSVAAANARALALANGNIGPDASVTIRARTGSTFVTAIVTLANGTDWVFNTSAGQVGEGASRLLAMRAATALISKPATAVMQKQNEASGAISQQFVRNR